MIKLPTQDHRRVVAGYSFLELKQKFRQTVAIAHISFTCLSGVLNQALENISPAPLNNPTQTTKTIEAAQKAVPTASMWQLFVGLAKEITKSTPESALQSAKQMSKEETLRRNKDLRPHLTKELPSRYGPPPPENRFAMLRGLA